MRKLSYLCILFISVYAIQGCTHSPKNNTPTADSLTAAADTVGKTKTAGTMTVNKEDAKFATIATGGGLLEVALANLALKKTNDARITRFANMMVTDHTNSNNDLFAIAKTKKIVLPTAISADDQKNMDSLVNKSAIDFDKAYVLEMIAAHVKTLRLMQGEAKKGEDAELKAFAAKTAPKVKMHLDSVIKIQSEIK